MLLKKLINIVLLSLCCFSAYANLPYYPIQFPRDDAAHYGNVPYPITNLTEWWYYNGKITTLEGRHFGYFIAVFHINEASDKTTPTSLLMLQLTDIDNQKVYSKRILYPKNEVIFSTQSLFIKLGNDFLLRKNNDVFVINDATLIDQDIIKLSLSLTPMKLPLLVNGTGLVNMWDNTNSYYYSNTHLQTQGTLEINGTSYIIYPELSSSWMDHQWGDFLLAADKAQWIWAGIQLDNSMDLSVWELINPKTKEIMWRLGNIISAKNTRTFTTDVSIAPTANGNSATYPLNYEVAVNLKPLHLQLALDALSPNQDSIGFWEGIHDVKGLFNGAPVKGFAYVENTVKNK